MSASSVLGKRKIAPDITGRIDIGLTETRVEEMIEDTVTEIGAVTESQVINIVNDKVTTDNLVSSNQATTIATNTTNSILTTGNYQTGTQVNTAIANYATTNQLMNQTQVNSSITNYATTNQLITQTQLDNALVGYDTVNELVDQDTFDAGLATKVGLTNNESISGTKTFTSYLAITPTTNQMVLGASSKATTINATQPSVSRTYTMPDVGADASFVMTEGAQQINGDKSFTGKQKFGFASASGSLLCVGSGGGADGAGTQSGNQIEFQYGFIGGFKHFIKSCHDGRPTPLNNKVQFFINSTNSQSASTAPGTGNTLSLEVGQTGISIPKSSNQIRLAGTFNGSGDHVNYITIDASQPIANRIYKIPDTGADSTFMLANTATNEFGAGLTYKGVFSGTFGSWRRDAIQPGIAYAPAYTLKRVSCLLRMNQAGAVYQYAGYTSDQKGPYDYGITSVERLSLDDAEFAVLIVTVTNAWGAKKVFHSKFSAEFISITGDALNASLGEAEAPGGGPRTFNWEFVQFASTDKVFIQARRLDGTLATWSDVLVAWGFAAMVVTLDYYQEP